MSVGKDSINCYPAPTAVQVVSRFAPRPMVYICSPLSGDVEGNQEKARRYCRFAVEQGVLPVAPHIYFTQFMEDSDPDERSLALFMDLALLSKCVELWVFGDVISEGMKAEIEWAKRHELPIRYFTVGCEEAVT